VDCQKQKHNLDDTLFLGLVLDFNVAVWMWWLVLLGSFAQSKVENNSQYGCCNHSTGKQNYLFLMYSKEANGDEDDFAKNEREKEKEKKNK